MAGVIQRVAMVSMHTSPTTAPGTADSGGMNVTILALAAELAIRGVEVDLLTRATGPASSRPLLPGVTLHELPAGAGGLRKEELSTVADEFGEAVAHVARSTPYDVIHSHYWLSGIATLPVALELGMPLVQSFHTVAAMKTKALGKASSEPPLRSRSETFIAAQADALVAVSAAEASALIDEVGAPADRTWIIPPGVDLELFAPRPTAAAAQTRRRHGLDEARPVVVLAGRVQPLKGHELAVRALAEIRAMRGWAPQLVIVGEVTPGSEGFVQQLHLLAEQSGVEHDIRFVGAVPRDELAELLATADLTIVPSFSETFGLVALESAACGTPVLGYRSGGLRESIAEDVSGLLLGTRDPRYWATELANLLENDERRAALGVSARTFAEPFSWGAAATGLLGVYAAVAR